MDEKVEKGSWFRLALDLWRRRKGLATVVFTAAATGALSVTISLPNVYRATATVLVERPQVPETVVKPSVTGEVETRLHAISEEILSRGRLSDLITGLDLYPDLRRGLPSEAVVQRMRSDIRLEFKGVEQSWGRGSTIAFSLSYLGRDPETAARVTNALTSFYVAENRKIRERQVAGTTEFLKAQLAETKNKLDEQARRLGDFKARYIGELPQQAGASMAALERISTRLRLNGEGQLRATERRERLVRQLPDAEAPGALGAPDATGARIAQLNRELTELQGRFTDKYPDVVRVKSEIAALQRQLAEAEPDGRPERKATPAADPALRRLREALREVDAELKALKDEEKSLRQTIAMHERRVEQAPKREQELQELSRDYEMVKELYFSLLKRYEEAQLAENVEHGQKGEQFRILDPAIPSKQPAAPNRLRLMLTGLMLSFGLAAATVVLAEQLDTSFHSADELRAFARVPVVASIPRIVREADRDLRVQRFVLATVLLGAGLVLIVGVSYYVAHGNEQLVQMLARVRS